MNLLLDDHGNFLIAIQGRSKNTVISYRRDLEQFFQFLLSRFKLSDETNAIQLIDLDLLLTLTQSDIYAYISYTTFKLNNSESSRKRKIAAIRSLYHYLSVGLHKEFKNPTSDIELPKIKKRTPAHMTLDESLSLLNAIEGKFKERDYAIITIFLNCGLRLSELTSLKIEDIQDEVMHIIGKGNKERLIFLNDACVNALTNYLKKRSNEIDTPYVFLNRFNKKISNRGVELLVEKHLNKAGLDTTKFSVHKLRHTAATLMYQYGEVDIRTLQKILGHENLTTTEIYTHVEDSLVQNALYKNPLANKTQA